MEVLTRNMIARFAMQDAPAYRPGQRHHELPWVPVRAFVRRQEAAAAEGEQAHAAQVQERIAFLWREEIRWIRAPRTDFGPRRIAATDDDDESDRGWGSDRNGWSVGAPLRLRLSQLQQG